MTDTFDLEGRLKLLRDDLIYPPTPDMVAALELPVSVSRSTRFDLPGWARLSVAAACLIVLVTAVIPATRAAVVEFFDVPGIRIEVGDADSPVTPEGAERLVLGREVEPSVLTQMSSIRVSALPPSLRYGVPTFYLDTVMGTPVVSLVYPPTEFLPEIGNTGAGLLLMQFAPVPSIDMFIKGTFGQGSPRATSVNGREAFWIENGTFSIESGDGEPSSTRSSANVLIWWTGEATYRMESNLRMEDSVLLAETLVPLADVVSGT